MCVAGVKFDLLALSGSRMWFVKTIWVSGIAKSGGVAYGPVIISSEPWDARRAAPSAAACGRCAAQAPRMLRLHYFSDHPALESASEEEESVYSIELIKEFEAVGRAWKAFLADWLLKGAAFVCEQHSTDILSSPASLFHVFFTLTNSYMRYLIVTFYLLSMYFQKYK